MLAAPSDVRVQVSIGHKLAEFTGLAITTLGKSESFGMRGYEYGVEIVGRVITVDKGPHVILAVRGVVEVKEAPPDTVTATLVL